MKFKIGDNVVHPDLYWGREVFEVVGIRKKQIEICGDFSGGTHNVSQSDWMDVTGFTKHMPIVETFPFGYFAPKEHK